jgi:two-component system, NarL family, response regulator NreC
LIGGSSKQGKSKVRVVLADNHAIVRQGVRALLERAGMTIAGEACDDREAVAVVSTTKPDVAVLDIGMPLLSGVEAALAIREASPATRIVVLTSHDEVQYVSEALRAGVKGYVLKNQSAGDLVHAIEQVGAGGIYLSPWISRALVDAYLANGEAAADPLTPRERQVLQMVGEGKSTKDVARLLGISTKTAESHRARLMRKLDIHETATLVRYAIRRGLVQP